MKRTSRRLWFCAIMLVLNISFIWGNSLLPGEVSGALSQWLKDLLADLLNMPSSDPSQGHGLLRKLAHFTEFACLGGLLSWLYGMLRKKQWLSLLCGFLVACTDETIQCFIPDRGPAVKDVLIDTSGVCVGIGLILLGSAIYKSRKNNKILEE